ncbi:hypothetical protein G7Y79_00074g098900 [Physcia stellaris]|nr:hypothetical protein G7Y79_00074g098900 [Physcia stellaris]
MRSLVEKISSASNVLSLPKPGLLEHVYRYRVPDTHITLYISFVPSQPITKAAMGVTILRTQQRLRDYMQRYDLEDTPLRRDRGEDPYESEEKYKGCFVGVASWPLNTKLLTYGMVEDVLQGLWLFLYREERFVGAVFEVGTDQYGIVGIGKIQPHRP